MKDRAADRKKSLFGPLFNKAKNEAPAGEEALPAEAAPEIAVDDTLPESSAVLEYLYFWKGHNLSTRAARHAADFLLGGGKKPFCWDRFETEAGNILRPQRDKLEKTPVNAKICVFTSHDKMEAWCVVFPSLFGGEDANAQDVVNTIKQYGVTSGYIAENIAALSQQTGYLKLGKIAEGVAALNGTDGRNVDLVFAGKSMRPVELEHGRVDFKNLDWIVNAKEGQPLCEVIFPTDPCDGMDVSGRILKGRPGKRAPKVSGKNTEYSEDGKYILSKIKGQVTMSGGRYTVDDLFEVREDVDLSTGNLKVNGSVLVRGNVRDGFEVSAGGSITVQGVVEGAILRAGRDIFIAKGMMGANKGELIAGGEIKCKFLENVITKSRGDQFFESVINSNIYCEGKVYVISGRGVVIGGMITAMRGVEASIGGNRIYRPTIFSVTCTPGFLERREKDGLELEKLAKEARDVGARIAMLERKGDAGSALGKLKVELSVIQLKIQNITKQLEEMKDVEQKIAEGSVQFEKVFPGVAITIGETATQIEGESLHCAFRLREGEIVMSVHR